VHIKNAGIVVSFLLNFTFLIEKAKTKDCELDEENSYISTQKGDE
jgi:hypothetical protein